MRLRLSAFVKCASRSEHSTCNKNLNLNKIYLKRQCYYLRLAKEDRCVQCEESDMKHFHRLCLRGLCSKSYHPGRK